MALELSAKARIRAKLAGSGARPRPDIATHFTRRKTVRRQQRIGFVHLLVAIVVDAIANLNATVGGCASVLATIVGIVVAIHKASVARTHRTGTRTATCRGLRELTSSTAGAAVVGVCIEVDAFVDLAIAVVVDSVTHLGPVDDAEVLTAGLQRIVVVKIRLARALNTISCGADIGCIGGIAHPTAATAIGWIRVDVDSLIGRPVAVIVLVVTDIEAAEGAGVLTPIGHTIGKINPPGEQP